MNGIGAKIILSFFGLVFFVVLILFSFSSSYKDIVNLPDFVEFQLGEYKYEYTENGEYQKSKVIFSELVEGVEENIFEKKIDIFTNVYSTNYNYTISKKGNKINLNIGTGAYLFDSKNLFQKVIINVGEYSIELENGGMVYIESTGNNDFVTSLNTRAKIHFKSGVEVYLYPHMYLGFKISRLSSKNEVDSLRLSQLANSLGYFSQQFGNISEGILVRLIKKESFFLKTLNIISKKQKKYTRLLEANIPNKVEIVSGIEYVEKYFSLFYNDKKKLVYYQNKVLKQSIELLKKTEIDNDTVIDIAKGLQKIKELDTVQYQEMLNLVDSFSYLAFNNIDNDILVQNYLNLIQKIHGFKGVLNMNLMQDFDRVNFNGEKVFYNKLLKSYNLRGSEVEQDYYLYFIRNIIFEGFKDSNLNEKNFNLLINIFGKYVESLKNVGTDNLRDDTSNITYIKYNVEILKAITEALLSRYFKERTNQGLLTRTSQKITDLSGFEKAIKKLLKFYDDGKISLDINISKYVKVIQNYKELRKQITEYFSALTNYSQYQKKYSNTGIAIEGVDVYSEENNDGLSKKKFVEYMKSFNGIDLNSIKLDINEDGYKINNITIKGRDFSFTMNPFRGNRIMDILAKNLDFEKNSREDIFYKQLGNITYEMDEEKEKYKKLLEKAKDEDRERLDFKNFFKNNFFPSDGLRRLSCEDDVNCKGRDVNVEDEDEVIQLFKTATLLGPKGEFKSIRNFLQVKYANLFVTKEKDSNFNITIQDSTLSIRIMRDKKFEPALSEFDSGYALEGAHYFYNLVLKPYEKSFGGEKDYVFGDIPLNVKGIIGIAKFESSMRDILEKIDYIEKKYRAYKLGNHGEISQINYFPKSGVVKFE